MKKLIATTASLAAIGFAVALAASEDPEWTGKTGSKQSKTNICIDANGKTFKPGSMGYEDCLREARRQKAQQAGQAPDTPEPDYPY